MVNNAAQYAQDIAERKKKAPSLVKYPRTLSPDEVVTRDLSHNPPPGFPRLPKRAAGVLVERIKDPRGKWADLYRRAGFSGESCEAHLDPRFQAYTDAMAAYREPRAETPARLRLRVVDVLGRVLNEGGRNAVLAARALREVGALADRESEAELAGIGIDGLREMLSDTLERVESTGKLLKTVTIQPPDVS